MERGIIAAPGIIKPLIGGFNMERSITPDEVRYYLMYWDKVTIPTNNLVHIGIPEEDELIRCQAIERPRITFQGSFGGDVLTNAILSCQTVIASEKVKDKNIDWCIHQFGQSLSLPQQYKETKDVIRFDLINALPVPSAETPIADILEFKQRRADELNELHHALDDIYIEILKSPDTDLTSKKQISDLKEKISNLHRAQSESFSKTKKFDLSLDLNISGKDLMLAASSGAVIDFLHNGLTMPIATMVGGVVSCLKISAKQSVTFSPAAKNKNLAYLSSAHREELLKNL